MKAISWSNLFLLWLVGGPNENPGYQNVIIIIIIILLFDKFKVA